MSCGISEGLADYGSDTCASAASSLSCCTRSVHVPGARSAITSVYSIAPVQVR